MTDRMGRRRTLTRAPGKGMSLLDKKGGSDLTRQPSDVAGSDVFHRSHHTKLENTYKLSPGENERFEAWRVEAAMKNVLESRLNDMEYDHDKCTSMSKDLVSEIHKRVKEFQWTRYKLVCQVTIGQSSRQGVQVVSRCVWDAKLDTYACVRYSNNSLFAVAQCYGVYFE